jgi:TerC family integral membrane protein
VVVITPWLIFVGFVLVMLALDLGVFHRKSHAVGFKESLGWSAVWITLGLSFSALVYQAYEHHWWGLGLRADAVDGMINDGRLAATKYLTGYVVEKSLSVDNIFVIAMIFGSLAVPARYQHRVLFWGILGALVMRGMMIGVGSALVTHFHWTLYIFGGFLIFTGLKMLFMKEKEERLIDTINGSRQYKDRVTLSENADALTLAVDTTRGEIYFRADGDDALVKNTIAGALIKKRQVFWQTNDTSVLMHIGSLLHIFYPDTGLDYILQPFYF